MSSSPFPFPNGLSPSPPFPPLPVLGRFFLFSVTIDAVLHALNMCSPPLLQNIFYSGLLAFQPFPRVSDIFMDPIESRFLFLPARSPSFRVFDFQARFLFAPDWNAPPIISNLFSVFPFLPSRVSIFCFLPVFFSCSLFSFHNPLFVCIFSFHPPNTFFPRGYLFTLSSPDPKKPFHRHFSISVGKRIALLFLVSAEKPPPKPQNQNPWMPGSNPWFDFPPCDFFW